MVAGRSDSPAHPATPACGCCYWATSAGEMTMVWMLGWIQGFLCDVVVAATAAAGGGVAQDVAGGKS